MLVSSISGDKGGGGGSGAVLACRLAGETRASTALRLVAARGGGAAVAGGDVAAAEGGAGSSAGAAYSAALSPYSPAFKTTREGRTGCIYNPRAAPSAGQGPVVARVGSSIGLSRIATGMNRIMDTLSSKYDAYIGITIILFYQGDSYA